MADMLQHFQGGIQSRGELLEEFPNNEFQKTVKLGVFRALERR